MIYQLSEQQENDLLILPETGMGFQIVEASRVGVYTRERFLVLNSEVVIELNASTPKAIAQLIKDGVKTFKESAPLISLNTVTVLTEKQFLQGEKPKKGSSTDGGITEQPVVQATGKEVFVRISAFPNDKRVDKLDACLRAGAFATTLEEYNKIKAKGTDPMDLFALPSKEIAKYAFHIQPFETDTLQAGTTPSANGRPGGGRAAFFPNGAASGSFKRQTAF